MFLYLFEVNGIFGILIIDKISTIVLIKRNLQIMVGIYVKILKVHVFQLKFNSY